MRIELCKNNPYHDERGRFTSPDFLTGESASLKGKTPAETAARFVKHKNSLVASSSASAANKHPVHFNRTPLVALMRTHDISYSEAASTLEKAGYKSPMFEANGYKKGIALGGTKHASAIGQTHNMRPSEFVKHAKFESYSKIAHKLDTYAINGNTKDTAWRHAHLNVEHDVQGYSKMLRNLKEFDKQHDKAYVVHPPTYKGDFWPEFKSVWSTFKKEDAIRQGLSSTKGMAHDHVIPKALWFASSKQDIIDLHRYGGTEWKPATENNSKGAKLIGKDGSLLIPNKINDKIRDKLTLEAIHALRVIELVKPELLKGRKSFFSTPISRDDYRAAKNKSRTSFNKANRNTRPRFRVSLVDAGIYQHGKKSIGIVEDFYTPFDPEFVAEAIKEIYDIHEDDLAVLLAEADEQGLDSDQAIAYFLSKLDEYVANDLTEESVDKCFELGVLMDTRKIEAMLAARRLLKGGNPNHDSNGRFSSSDDDADGGSSKPSGGKPSRAAQSSRYSPAKIRQIGGDISNLGEFKPERSTEFARQMLADLDDDAWDQVYQNDLEMGREFEDLDELISTIEFIREEYQDDDNWDVPRRYNARRANAR